MTLTDVNGSMVWSPFSTTDDVTSLGGAYGTASGDSTGNTGSSGDRAIDKS